MSSRAAFAFGLAALVGCASQAPAPAATIDGAAIFLRNCSACHGEQADGRGLAQSVLVTPPRDFTTEDARLHLSREYMIAIVRDGRPHTAMVGRTARLTHAEIEATVDFIRTAFVPPEPGSTRARGRDLYRDACASCHQSRGGGAPARAGRPAVPALSRTGAPQLTAERMRAALERTPHVPGTSGSFASLAPHDVAAVIDYVRGTFIEQSAAGRR